MRPYVEGGYSYNHLSSILTANIPVYNPRWPQIMTPTLTTLNRNGVLFGAGVEIKLPPNSCDPGIRYLPYDKGRPNTADFLVGINLNSIYRRTGKPKQ